MPYLCGLQESIGDFWYMKRDFWYMYRGLLVHVSGTFGTCKAYRGLLVLAFKPA